MNDSPVCGATIYVTLDYDLAPVERRGDEHGCEQARIKPVPAPTTGETFLTIRHVTITAEAATDDDLLILDVGRDFASPRHFVCSIPCCSVSPRCGALRPQLTPTYLMIALNRCSPVPCCADGGARPPYPTDELISNCIAGAARDSADRCRQRLSLSNTAACVTLANVSAINRMTVQIATHFRGA